MFTKVTPGTGCTRYAVALATLLLSLSAHAQQERPAGFPPEFLNGATPSSKKSEPVVYDKKPYLDLFEKLQLDAIQVRTWERVVRAHQAKALAMQGVFLPLEAVGTMGNIKAEILGVQYMLAPLSREERVSEKGKRLATILRSMENVQQALDAFYRELTPYQVRDYEVHQTEMMQREVARRAAAS